MIRRMGKVDVQRRKLLPALMQPSWFDPNTRGPRALKLLRTIRLDPSDTFVFENAAEPGEWAVTGAFLFADVDPATLQGKERSAFRSGLSRRDVAGLVDARTDRGGEREDQSRLVEALAHAS